MTHTGRKSLWRMIAFALVSTLALVAPDPSAAQTPHGTTLRLDDSFAPKGRSQSATSLACEVCTPDARPAALDAPREPAAASRVETSRTTRARTPRRRGIHRTWHYANGRELNANLTPSPERCAPLIELRF
jgi:hypothetical protein